MTQRWPRDAVARFLGKLLESDSAIPDSYFSEFPDLFRSLIEQEDSRLQGDKNSFRDWLTTAINSIRGEAIEALLNLALRQKNAGREIQPWILEIFRSRLELAEESPAIFALLGVKLRLLIHLFGNRLMEFQGLLFPPAKPEHRSAALIAHFKYDHPSSAIIEIFPGLINAALDTLETIRTNVKDDHAKEDSRELGYRLGTHIACYYWCGSFAGDEEGEAALDRFFAIASDTTRAVLINEIGTIWEKPPNGPPDEKVIARVMRIWERRYAQIVKELENRAGSASDHDAELAQSIDWLDCECFPLDWRLAHAKSALERLQKAPQAYRLLKSISALGVVPNRLEGSLELLQMLLSKPGDEVRWSIQFQDLGPVLSSGFASGKPEIRRLAKECQDMLLKRGFSDFLSL